MGVTEVASNVVDGLKGNPPFLAMIVVNVIWLAAAGWFLTTINSRAEARDNMIINLIKQKDCPEGMRLQSGEDAPYDINKDAAKN